jgi:hypothetical protein
MAGLIIASLCANSVHADRAVDRVLDRAINLNGIPIGQEVDNSQKQLFFKENQEKHSTSKKEILNQIEQN